MEDGEKNSKGPTRLEVTPWALPKVTPIEELGLEGARAKDLLNPVVENWLDRERHQCQCSKSKPGAEGCCGKGEDPNGCKKPQLPANEVIDLRYCPSGINSPLSESSGCGRRGEM